MKSIKSQLIVLFTVILLVSLVVFGVVSTNRASHAVLTEAEAALEYSAQEAAKYINSRVYNQLTYIDTLAQNPIIFDQELSWQEKARYFEREAERTGYTGFAFANKEGQSRIFDQQETVLDISERDYFQAALAGNPATSDIIISMLGDGAIIIYAVPVKENGDVIGVFYGWRDGLAISEMLADINFGETGISYTINDEGIVTGHEDIELVLEQHNIMAENTENDELIDAKKNMIAGKGGTERFVYGGQKIAASAKVENTPWTLVMTVDEDEFLAGINQLRTTLLILGIIVVLIGIVLTYATSIKIVKPIKAAVSYADQIADLDITQRVEQDLLTRKDEMGVLSRALQNVAWIYVNILDKILGFFNKITPSLTIQT